MRSFNMKRMSLWDVESPESVPNETIISLWNTSPASVLAVNPGLRPRMDALLSRAPLGWEHVQLNGTVRYDLVLTDRTREQEIQRRIEEDAQWQKGFTA